MTVSAYISCVMLSAFTCPLSLSICMFTCGNSVCMYCDGVCIYTHTTSLYVTTEIQTKTVYSTCKSGQRNEHLRRPIVTVHVYRVAVSAHTNTDRDSVHVQPVRVHSNIHTQLHMYVSK